MKETAMSSNLFLAVSRAEHEPKLLESAREFTKKFAATKDLHPAEREIRCLQTLYPGILLGPCENDLFAGRVHRPLAGVSNVFYPEGYEGDDCGYYYDKVRADRILATHFDADSEARIMFEELAAFWKNEASYRSITDGMDDQMRTVLFSRKYVSESAVCHRLHRVASPSIDYSTLLDLGVRGYQNMLEAQKQHVERTVFLDAACEYLNLFTHIMSVYATEFNRLAEKAEEKERRLQLRRVSHALEALNERPPRTFFEALQLVHLYTVTGFTANAFGRLDDDFGHFLKEDLESGRLTREEAVRLLVHYWQLLSEHFVNSRMTLGGSGRRDPEAADLFCDVALEATRVYYTNIAYRQERVAGLPLSPQVAFRMDHTTPLALRTQALDVIASGATFPILYDDEANVPAVAHAFRIEEQEAQQYTFFDCGEYLIHGRSIGTPSTIINLPKALEVALHNGIDPRTNRRVGPSQPPLNNFEDVWRAYTSQVEHDIVQCARFQKHQFEVLKDESGFVAMSLLMNDCVKQGKTALDGGCEYLGGTIETYGNITVSDSLYAIKRAVFEEQRISLDELISQLDSDFANDEQLAQYLLNLPKFGNDIDAVDTFAQRVTDHISIFTREQAALVGLHHYLMVVINNGVNVSVGYHVNATADGRRKGKPVSNGHTPTAGFDTSGITALVNSMLKLSAYNHGGAVHNLRFTKQTIRDHRDMVEAILESYFNRGGTQCMITITSREELEDAQLHPECYGHLLVRVGGYSARFIDLPKDIQAEVIRRTSY